MENTDNILKAYCLKCKDKKEIINGKIMTNKKGNKYLQSNCSVCNNKINKFLKKDTKIDVDLSKE